jgi:hypothetical protein
VIEHWERVEDRVVRKGARDKEPEERRIAGREEKVSFDGRL